MSSSVNVLTNSPKILHSTNIGFFQLNYVNRGMNKYNKGTVEQISTVFGPFSHVFFEETSKSAFYSSKFNVDFKNSEKNSEKVFRYNSILIGCVKFSL